MNTLTYIQRVKVLAGIILVTLVLQGCEKEEPVPGYVGTWVSEQDQTKSSGKTEVRDWVDFSEGSFTHIGQVKDVQNNKWLDFIGVKGRITIADNTMKVEVLEMGISKIDVLSGLPTGIIYYYRPDQPEFNNILKRSQVNIRYQSEFYVDGNKLILRTDRNNDGDFAEVGEESVFVKQ